MKTFFRSLCVSAMSVSAMAMAAGTTQGSRAQQIYEALGMSEVVKEPVRLGVRVHTKEVGGLECKRVTGVLPMEEQFSCTLGEKISGVAIYTALNVNAVPEEPPVAGEWNEIKEVGGLACTRRALGYPHARAHFHCWLSSL